MHTFFLKISLFCMNHFEQIHTKLSPCKSIVFSHEKIGLGVYLHAFFLSSSENRMYR